MSQSYSDIFRVFGRIGLQSFGGPAAQIALMHKELVEDHTWLNEDQFLRALSFCMLLPGPEAMQLATYAGWRQMGILGGLIAGGLFVVPGAIVITILALAYGTYGDLGWVQTMFVGIQAAVVVVVVDALRKVGRKALGSAIPWCLAIAAFIGLFVFGLPFPLVVFAAAVFGARYMAQPAQIDVEKPTWTHLKPVVLIGGIIWAAPILVAWIFGATFLTEIGVFFSKLAVVTFGGAYSVLAYMAQTVVADFGWLTAEEMLDALGLAETTPGPLILVTQFVGMLAALSEGGIWLALLAGLMTLWVTFVPCFIWIFAGAPLIEWLSGQSRLQGALKGITASVVGVIANLSLWFALHVFFAEVSPSIIFPKMVLPDLSTIDPLAVGLAVLASFLLYWRKLPLLLVLTICAAAALAVVGLLAV